MNLVLDAWAILAYLFHESPADKVIKEVLLEALHGKKRLYLNVINLGEVFYILAKMKGKRTAEETIKDIQKLPIHIVECSKTIVFDAAKFKAKHKISYTDAFVLATAIFLDAAIITGDPELISLKNFNIKKLERNK